MKEKSEKVLLAAFLVSAVGSMAFAPLIIVTVLVFAALMLAMIWDF